MTNFEVTEPLTYRQDTPHSYFRDLVFADREPDAKARLERHSREMAVVGEAQQQRAVRALAAGDIEYRISPDTTQGNGGYFTVPLWINQLFASAPRPKRVLADLIAAKFPLPDGVSSVNLPIITSPGTGVAPAIDDAPVLDQDYTDAPGSSVVATFAGEADVALQLLEQSPPGAHLDWVIFTDLADAYDSDLEAQLFLGNGVAQKQILGVLNVPGTVGVTFTQASPTGPLLYPYFGQAASRVGNNRNLPPEAWFMNTSRWGWLSTQETTSGYPFGLSSPFFLGNTDDTPDPVGGVIGFPVFLDEALPSNLGAGSNQEVIVAMRPSDLILMEATPVTAVMREPLSGSLGVRLQLHNRVACITNRYPSGISPITGTGLIVQTGFTN